MKQEDKRQLWIILGISSLLSMVFSGLEVVYTAYAINAVGVDASEWSQIRSIRYTLTMIVVFVLGTYAIRLGTKITAVFAVVMSAIALICTVLFPGKLMLYVMYPIFGSLTQILLVNMNVMAQETSSDMREMTNTLYRSSFIAFSMAGPLAGAFWMTSSYANAFLFFSLLLALCVGVLTAYPSTSAKLQHLKLDLREMKKILNEWAVLCRNRSILGFVILTAVINQTVMINMTLLPIKLMDGMGITEQHYSTIVTFQSAIGFILILSVGFLLKKHLNVMIYAPYILCAVGLIGMGSIEHPVGVIVAFVLSNAIFQITMAPSSLWLSQQVDGSGYSTIFSFAKISSSLQGAIATVILALLQPIVGIDASLMIYGIWGLLCSLALVAFLKFR